MEAISKGSRYSEKSESEIDSVFPKTAAQGGVRSLFGDVKGALAAIQEVADHRTNRGNGRQRHRPLSAELLLLGGQVEIDQHDDEQKQHHDAAHIQNDLHREEKLGVL